MAYLCAGPIFSLDLAGQPAIVINDFTTAGDLLGMYFDAAIRIPHYEP